jgi:hypothetical protein
MIWAETGMCQRSPTNTFQRGLENGHKISKRLLLSQLFDSEKNGKATFLHRMSLQTHGSFNCFHNHGLQYIHVLLMDEILHGLG